MWTAETDWGTTLPESPFRLVVSSDKHGYYHQHFVQTGMMKFLPSHTKNMRRILLDGLFFFPLVALALFISGASPVTCSAQPAAADAATAGQAKPDSPSEADSFAGAPVFQPEDVVRKARELASRPYENPAGQVPDLLLKLNTAQWNSIRFRPDHALWANSDSLFKAQFFHPGFIFNRVVTIHSVQEGRVTPYPSSHAMFEYNRDLPVEAIKQIPLSFAGFSLIFPLSRPSQADEILSFLGASYFRALGRNSRYGISARGLAVNTSLPEGEEFPYFREFWLVQPSPRSVTITLYALMDSPSLTGAYTFRIKPGDTTVMDVEAKLFMRTGTPGPQKIGLAPLTSMFLYSETDNGRSGDFRPEVHDSDGLLYLDGDNDWNWRPLANPYRLAVNVFPVSNPRGFGLMQRDNVFDHYQDLVGRYDMHSSLWVEPKGDWGDGHIELIEIPSKEEIHSNVTVFWVPVKPRPTVLVGAENDVPPQARYQDEMNLAYRLYWMPPGNTPHGLGRAIATRTAKSQKNDSLRFIIDFESELLNQLPEDTGLTSVIETPAEAPVIGKILTKNPVTQGWRLDFTVRLPRQDGMVQSLVTIREGIPPLRFRALLKKGENLPDALTETWVYDLNL